MRNLALLLIAVAGGVSADPANTPRSRSVAIPPLNVNGTAVSPSSLTTPFVDAGVVWTGELHATTVQGDTSVASPLGKFDVLDAGTLNVVATLGVGGALNSAGNFNLGSGCFINVGGAMTVGCSASMATNVNMSTGTNGYIDFTSAGFGPKIAGKVTLSPGAPTATSACTSPSITNETGTETSVSFKFNVGTSCTGVSTLVAGLPTAGAGWHCSGDDEAHLNRNIKQSASSTSSVTMTNVSTTLGTAADWADSSLVIMDCTAR